MDEATELHNQTHQEQDHVPGKTPNLKDNQKIASFVQKLAIFNKNQKPPTTWSDDLTKEQRNSRSKQLLTKRNKAQSSNVGCFPQPRNT
uniref:Uncharacterized protein n=1 Tax=Romanomermis culicivorax TaxID=13658 RepID=A0A915IML4_ROMCU